MSKALDESSLAEDSFSGPAEPPGALVGDTEAEGVVTRDLGTNEAQQELQKRGGVSDCGTDQQFQHGSHGVDAMRTSSTFQLTTCVDGVEGFYSAAIVGWSAQMGPA